MKERTVTMEVLNLALKKICSGNREKKSIQNNVFIFHKNVFPDKKSLNLLH